MTHAELAAIRERYQRTGTPKPLWQEVCIDIAALLAEVERLSARPGDGNGAAMADLVELPMPTMKCEKCRGTGILRQYPRDSRWCERCKGTGAIAVHPTHVLGYGCNRCQTTWDKPNPPYCAVCGADATHYRTAP